MYRFAQKHRWFSSLQLLLLAASLLWNSAVSATSIPRGSVFGSHESVLHADPRTDWAHFVFTSELTAEVKVETEVEPHSEDCDFAALGFSPSPVVGWTVPRRAASESEFTPAPRQGGPQSKLYLALRVLRI